MNDHKADSHPDRQLPDRELIINARLAGHQSLQQVLVETGKIKKISLQTSLSDLPEVSPNIASNINDLNIDLKIDLNGDWLSLGGVDLQINGGLGLAFPDLELKDFSKLQQICDFLWKEGIDCFLPTIVTTSIAKTKRSLGTIAQFMAEQDDAQNIPSTAKIIGVHLEGPFLNYQKRGAHPAKYLLPLTIKHLQEVLGEYSHIVRLITLAPELDSSGQAIAYLKEQNIIVSLGHSLATDIEAKKAFAQGASVVTHGFNAMPSLHHRHPGLLGEAIVNPHVYCGLIADGNHVCPTMLEIVMKASNYDQGIFLVSDALSPMGLADGVYPWDEREITVTGGTARLPDGTLSGTTLPLLVAVENLVKWGCDIDKAIAMATESPRQAINLPGIGIGQAANLLRWHWNEEQQKLSWSRLDLMSGE